MTSEKITKLLADYAAGKRDFRGVDLAGADLRGANLAFANLAFANLAGANLAGAKLFCAKLAGAKLSRANLKDANLVGADLVGADLRGAILTGAILTGAKLARANLAGANLSGANLSGADLAGADLAGANLSRVNLTGADLAGADGLPEIEPFPIDAGIAEAVADGAHLDMSTWHNSCGTAHCRAGWAVTLHPQGAELEAKYGTNAAAALIYNACSISERTPNWYANSAEALADIRRLAELASKVVAAPADVPGTP
jgi:uncharacterized protein YjbI with pentapeptide repeats